MCSGYKIIVQVSLQVLFLLLINTETATTGGLETLFNKNLFWMGFDPIIVLCLSIGLSLFTCVKNHTNIISAEKVFSPMTSKILIFTWGTFANLRRILSLITMFIPSIGLFNILHHWRAEQIPFRIRLNYAKKFTILKDDRISLNGLNETIYWSQLDRWDYTDQDHPTPPPYSIYTLLSLQNTFTVFIFLSILQFIIILSVKILTSEDFRQEYHKINKVIHVLENINYASPFKDWDQGNHNIDEFRKRFRLLRKEMLATFAINFLFTIVMMVPLYFCGKY